MGKITGPDFIHDEPYKCPMCGYAATVRVRGESRARYVAGSPLTIRVARMCIARVGCPKCGGFSEEAQRNRRRQKLIAILNISLIGAGFPLVLGVLGGKGALLGGFVMSALVVPLCIFV